MTKQCFQRSAVGLLVGGCLLCGCVTRVGGVDPTTTRRVETDDEPYNRVLDKPSVQELLSACDALARKIGNCTAIQYADHPVVIEIAPMVDKTNQGLDLTICGQIIREKLVQAGAPNVSFRDEESRDDILAERMAQSDAPILVTTSESATTTGSKHIKRPGGYRGPGGTGTAFDVVETAETTVKTDQQAEISGRRADVDYFLKGFVYVHDERSAGKKSRGYRYYRFQYRLTDARSGIVPCEEHEDLKNVGTLRD
ncbi:MAG: hypothetical protein ACE5HE_04060 [Phycisphaerae bacterium]